MQIFILVVGKNSKRFQLEIDEYLKRLKAKVTFKYAELRQEKGDVALKKEAEAKLLLDATEGNPVRVVLDEHGKDFSSEAFSGVVEKYLNEGARDFAFYVGGADGHGKSLLEAADVVLSLGKMTWPHAMVPLLLAEQLYRAQTIREGHPYHRK